MDNEHITPVWSPKDFRNTVAAMYRAGLFRADLFYDETAEENEGGYIAPVIDLTTRQRLA